MPRAPGGTVPSPSATLVGRPIDQSSIRHKDTSSLPNASLPSQGPTERFARASKPSSRLVLSALAVGGGGAVPPIRPAAATMATCRVYPAPRLRRVSLARPVSTASGPEGGRFALLTLSSSVASALRANLRTLALAGLGTKFDLPWHHLARFLPHAPATCTDSCLPNDRGGPAECCWPLATRSSPSPKW